MQKMQGIRKPGNLRDNCRSKTKRYVTDQTRHSHVEGLNRLKRQLDWVVGLPCIRRYLPSLPTNIHTYVRSTTLHSCEFI